MGADRDRERDQAARLELVLVRAADFHCVAGWSATDLHWEGVTFEAVYRAVGEPALLPGAAITHVVCRGLDGHPLDGDHGAPARLVSPRQYGYFNVKHLSRIEVLTAAPTRTKGPLIRSHPRGRVWEEERHGLAPAWLVRPFYRASIGPIRRMSARGAVDQSRFGRNQSSTSDCGSIRRSA
ncbi:molybdopterin-dependent oxidoreductase [Pseudonocardia sp. DLS-67]